MSKTLFALWLVKIMLIFTRLCQIERQPHILLIIICVMTGANYTHFYAIVPKQPPPNAFFEACSRFKEKNFDLICESCLLFYEIFMWYYWRDCDTCSLFDCAKLPLKCIFCVATRVTFVFEKMVGVFSMTALAVICVCIIFHTQLFLIQETLLL